MRIACELIASMASVILWGGSTAEEPAAPSPAPPRMAFRFFGPKEIEVSPTIINGQEVTGAWRERFPLRLSLRDGMAHHFDVQYRDNGLTLACQMDVTVLASDEMVAKFAEKNVFNLWMQRDDFLKAGIGKDTVRYVYLAEVENGNAAKVESLAAQEGMRQYTFDDVRKLGIPVAMIRVSIPAVAPAS
jgi:hypothetical protein